ncbi:hypothetical protein OESDEN_23342 [Oesophagostomum dentatum]|uniref:Uncharacterized protein n=1 Tax=Oesophagostomum dentatum TaxID=61180 RepID=A0A0B1RVB8_OESDE|nr:hypothetical protein OESDEN_23342 [Oesophagostomum dentatum]
MILETSWNLRHQCSHVPEARGKSAGKRSAIICKLSFRDMTPRSLFVTLISLTSGMDAIKTARSSELSNKMRPPRAHHHNA